MQVTLLSSRSTIEQHQTPHPTRSTINVNRYEARGQFDDTTFRQLVSNGLVSTSVPVVSNPGAAYGSPPVNVIIATKRTWI
jgi:hypothetical protein